MHGTCSNRSMLITTWPTRSRLSRQLTIDSDQLPSLPDNPCEVPNVEPERSMVASIGNGRKRFTGADTSGKMTSVCWCGGVDDFQPL